MNNSLKKSYLALSFAVLLYICLQLFLDHIILKSLFSLIYLWIPGFIALFYARKDKIRLPVFKRLNKYFYLAPLTALLISLSVFLLNIPFGSISSVNQDLTNQPFLKQLGYGLIYFFNYYIVFMLTLSLFFLGGELYWRGFLWEKLKSKPFQAVWIIALTWSLWMIPTIPFSISSSPNSPDKLMNLFWVLGYNFVITPILLYYRIKGRSILVSTIFYTSLFSASMYFRMLFPVFEKKTQMISLATIIVLLIIYSLFLKLYSKSFWNSLKE